MGSPSTLFLYSPPNISLEARVHRGETFRCSRSFRVLPGLFPAKAPFVNRGRLERLLLLRAASSSKGDVGPRPRVYTESQGQDPLPLGRVKEFAAFAVPAGAFLAITLVLWKLLEKVLPKTSTYSSVASKPSMQGIKWSPGTSVLQCFGAKAGGEPRKRLNHFAKELRSSSRVDISGCNFGDDGLFFLAESLAYNQVMAAEEVNFAANGITAAGLKAFDGCLCDILVGNAGIQKLQLNSADLGDEGAKAIAEMLKKNSSLHVLELNNNMIDYSGFTSLAGALLENDSIQSLYLNGNYCGALGAAALAKGLEGNKSLREISLQGNSIGDEGVRALMSSLSLREGRLQHLDIGNNAITSKGAFHVAEYVRESKSLVFLNLSMNDIGDEAASDLGKIKESVGKFFRMLILVSIAGATLGISLSFHICVEVSNELKEMNANKGAEKIAEALKQNQSLANLDLGGNNIHAKGASAIAQVLKENSIITKASLEISYNRIGPHGAKALFEVLKSHGNIKTLSLGWCQIGAMGVEFIADALKYNSTISTLDLRANGLGDEGAICLAQSLKVVNGTLTSLDLGFNEIRDDGAFAIARALKANEDVSITKLNLASNSISKLGQGVLTDAIDHVYEMAEKEVNIFF
ncbi:hypothetical protein RHGRI_034474 [Rhododendron griersonianum]|uniref:RNI-like superfamily protein n=1 Tax=Rhododendron griersonianum TaxID=479676 RepID=A0AAV6I0S5_9ERIC|nr:hypothetical protein RHGRI_034474 [Rhododendron griersonianum]